MRLRVAGFGKTEIPFDMFDVAREAAEARRAVKLASLYHKGQELAWDGREVLRGLLDAHGGIHIADDKRAAIRKLFAIILWGELAAWKISTQLADRLVPLEAKLAATSQAHDEARHFYVMYDYLGELGEVPTSIDRPSRAVLDLVLNTDDLTKKLIGMQLMVETLALTIFQAVRETGIEPVLCELLKYYEKDEARHVGLGVQFLPAMLAGNSPLRAADLMAFQLKIVAWTLAGLKNLEPELRTLGIDPRRIMFLGKGKQITANEALWREMGIGRPATNETVYASVDALAEFLFPTHGRALSARLAGMRHVYRQGGFRVAPGPLVDNDLAAAERQAD
jgi:hypothetical protein